MDDPQQLSVFPYDRPDAVLNLLAQAVTRVTRLAPDLQPFHCIVLAGDLARFLIIVDHMETQVKAGIAAAAHRFDLIA